MNCTCTDDKKIERTNELGERNAVNNCALLLKPPSNPHSACPILDALDHQIASSSQSPLKNRLQGPHSLSLTCTATIRTARGTGRRTAILITVTVCGIVLKIRIVVVRISCGVFHGEDGCDIAI